MYHGTVSGSFKNALDWLQLLSDSDPPYLTNKVVGLVSTAGGVQGLRQSQRSWKSPLTPAPLRIMESPPLLPRLASLATSLATPPTPQSIMLQAHGSNNENVQRGILVEETPA